VTPSGRLSSRPSHVQERLIGALIPDALGPRGDSVSVPMPVLPALHRLDHVAPVSLLVSTCRMDRSGRIHERLMLRELGWEPGDRVDMDTIHGIILIANTPTGLHTIDHRGAIKLPATLRRLCNINYGPPLVLAAAIPEQVMVVHPGNVVADMLAKHYTHLIQSEQPAEALDPELEEGTP
jgi:bifunctional DNA-binding transcriptional regulator/antitoxin component of YhaV-PrlF toxin-antitoxin module